MPEIESESNHINSNLQDDQDPPNVTAATAWNAAFDQASQKWYYYNLETEERSWDPPSGWISDTAEAKQALEGYYYKDAHGIEQGPFSIHQLQAWRGALPMDLPVWKIDTENDQKEKETNTEPNTDKESGERQGDGDNNKQLKRSQLLAQILGDAELLAQWRTAHPEITETICAAPSAIAFERELQQQIQQLKSELNAKLDRNNNDESEDNKLDFAASLAEAVIAGLPEDDEAVQLARAAASAGQSLQQMVEKNRKQKAEVEGYEVTAMHTSGRGRIQALNGGETAESLYGDMGSWIDPKSMEEQMKKAGGKKRKLTAEEVEAVKHRKKEIKGKKQRAWLQD
jgi:hypothetical protein